MSPELTPDQLRRTFDPKVLGVKTTDQLPALDGRIIGQERAVRALQFGLHISSTGFNTYVSGPPGIGKMTAIQTFLEELARRKETPPDWCYVNNFDDPYQPKALRLPPGTGRRLQQDMKALIEHLRAEIPKAFESDEYSARRDEILSALGNQREALLQELSERAAREGFALQATPLGILIVPVREGRPLTDAEFQALPDSIKEELQRHRDALQEELKAAMKEIRRLERATGQRLQELDQQVALYIVGDLVDDLIEKYRDLPGVVEHLQAVQKDILENIEPFKTRPTLPATPANGPQPPPWAAEVPFRKYDVNVLVDNGGQEGAPVVLESNPIYNNLFGRIEKETQFGTLYTDFTMIKAGSLHRANGGYLVLPVEDVVTSLFSWDGLKRALHRQEIQIEEMGERLGFLATKSLRPQPIPLDIKVLLVGRPLIYYMLYAFDEEFPELFKVKADFDIRMDADDENIRDFVSFLCTLCEKENLKHIEDGAMGKLLEHAARLADDQEKLSTHFGAIADLVREANFWAEQENSPYISAPHVKRALDEKVYRSNLIQERIKELIARGTLLIDTEGASVGQVNGLAVIGLGDYEFGKPSRITASVGPGREGIVDIEREVELGGPIHSKGVLILGGYLSYKYAQDKPLTLAARLVFEQSYEGIEGDSASSAELYALLSALSGLPIRQNIAVTGSVNQHGEVQAIGGVNEKIEGFFDVCVAKGLTGDQGVMIPASNVQNLMLREDVVEAVRDGKFHIWAVRMIDEGIEILTGVPAGERGPDGGFPEGTVNYLVERRLRELMKTLEEAGEGETPPKKERAPRKKREPEPPKPPPEPPSHRRA
jgi:lon-related putative ATP-dependent protease